MSGAPESTKFMALSTASGEETGLSPTPSTFSTGMRTMETFSASSKVRITKVRSSPFMGRDSNPVTVPTP